MKCFKIVLCAIAFGATTNVSPAAWQYARGDSANTGFAMVDTAPAVTPQVQPLGTLAPGANPVIGPNGDVYIGNLEGELRVFHADGTPYWTRKLDNFGGIFAAPVVGTDGSIYVASSTRTRVHGENGQVINDRNDSYLHKFSPAGAWQFWKPFPERFSPLESIRNGGTTTAPPNIWYANGTEAIIVPVIYKAPLSRHLRLIAFSTSGTVLADQLVTDLAYPDVTSTSEDYFPECLDTWGWLGYAVCPIIAPIFGPIIEYCCSFSSTEPQLQFPLPGVGIAPDPRGEAPLVLVTDGRYDKIIYAFSAQTGFSEVHRTQHLLRHFTTPPVVLPSGDTITGTLDGYLTRTGYNWRSNQFVQKNVISGLGALTAAPTRLSDGSLVVVSREGRMTVIGSALRTEIQLSGESIASAAVSCNHIFVADTNQFTTFDAKTLAQIASVPWTNGGLNSPVIGPSGHVYAIASNHLYVFPPPIKPVWDTRPPSCFLSPPVSTR